MQEYAHAGCSMQLSSTDAAQTLFCRNVYRGASKMCSLDKEALALAKELIVSPLFCFTDVISSATPL